MTKNLIIANGIILFYIIQRITEMLISKENERWLKENCFAVEVDPKEGLKMKLFHTFWFVSLLIETNVVNDIQVEFWAFIIYSLLAFCMMIRIYSIEKLNRFWTIKIFSMENQVLFTDGLYKYIRHPNYLIVIVEFLLLPLLFKAYFTMILFSFLNLLVLSKRINLEEVTLMAQSNYSEKFKNIKRFVPYFLIFGLFIFNPVSAKEVSYMHKNFEMAKKAESYIKFDGESTKLGFITTGFTGYAREFKINYDLISTQLNKLEVVILASALDTDLGARNDKMVNTILNIEKYPEIHAFIDTKIELVNGEQTINMTFQVKDQKISKPVKVVVEKRIDHILVTGDVSLGLKELGLPDPSIAIAKVNDIFKLAFSVRL